MIKHTFLALCLIAAPAALTACNPKPKTMTYVDPQKDALIEARDKARETLPKFWEMLDNPPAGTSNYSVKVAFPTTDNSLEHIWMDKISRTDGRMTAVIANEPYAVADLKIGDRVSFVEDDISDWQYMKDEKLYGHYTTRTMFDTMNAEQKRQVKALLSEEP
ncbi:YegJ family protein [Litorimonas sp. RW-G-Af-16]|uniref:YegJ family protein n=1 Tax=Litorimonas sp. RW-G-Af-16 TaxID=3241168 RepID=UPI00390C99E1